jgi:hypothetical protein
VFSTLLRSPCTMIIGREDITKVKVKREKHQLAGCNLQSK